MKSYVPFVFNDFKENAMTNEQMCSVTLGKILISFSEILLSNQNIKYESTILNKTL